MNVEQQIAELTARLDSLEGKVEEQDQTIEELRYAGTARDRTDLGLYPNDDYDEFMLGEWDSQ